MDNIETILYAEYGASPVSAPMEAVLWALEKISDAAKAKAELARLNAIRSQHGSLIITPPFGHHAF